MHDLKNRPVAMQEVTYPKRGQTNKRKLMITGVASAAIACLVCLVPAAIIVAGAGGAFAVFSGWLGYAAAAVVALGLASSLWLYKKRACKCGCSNCA